MASILDDVHLSARTVRGLGIALVVIGLLLPLVAVIHHAATWVPSEEFERFGPLRPELVILPAGTFLMGSPEDEPDRGDDETLHEVTLTRRFAISRTEITQRQYSRVRRDDPVADRMATDDRPCSGAGLGDDLPVVCVTWLEAVHYCNALSRLEGLDPVYTVDRTHVTWNEEASGYRLPTEAEWEYAARAGTRQRFVGTDAPDAVCDRANVADLAARAVRPDWRTFGCDDGFIVLAPVTAKPANRWHLHGMGGNAAEWVWDAWDGVSPYSLEPVTDPRGGDESVIRVFRGGSWKSAPTTASIARRFSWVPSGRNDQIGFRVARSLPPIRSDEAARKEEP